MDGGIHEGNDLASLDLRSVPITLRLHNNGVTAACGQHPQGRMKRKIALIPVLIRAREVS